MKLLEILLLELFTVKRRPWLLSHLVDTAHPLTPTTA